MNKYHLISIVCSLFLWFGCEKEEFLNHETMNEEIYSMIEKDKPIPGSIACIIFDEFDNVLCWGERCGTPTGNCRIGITCKCRTANKSVLGRTVDEFNALWSLESSRDSLIRLGYYEKDMH